MKSGGIWENSIWNEMFGATLQLRECFRQRRNICEKFVLNEWISSIILDPVISNWFFAYIFNQILKTK